MGLNFYAAYFISVLLVTERIFKDQLEGVPYLNSNESGGIKTLFLASI